MQRLKGRLAINHAPPATITPEQSTNSAKTKLLDRLTEYGGNGLVSSPRKLVHISTAHPWHDTRIYYRMCRSLAAAGFDVHLVATEGAYAPTEKNSLSNVRLRLLPNRQSRISRAVLNGLQSVAYVLKHRPALIHFHDPEFLPYALLLRFLRFKIIFDVHENIKEDFISKIYFTPTQRRIAGVIFHWSAWLIPYACDALIAAAKDIAESLEHKPELYSVVQNYPDIAAIRGISAEQMRPGSCGPTNIYFFGGVRGCGTAKIILDAVALVHQKTPARLQLGGPILSYQELALLKTHPAWQLVDFHGHTTHNTAILLLAKSHVAIILYTDNGNTRTPRSNRLYEAMCLGVPVITANSPNWTDFISRYACGRCVNANDSGEIAHTIASIVRADAATGIHDTIPYGRNGIAATNAEFNWATQQEKLLALYAALLPS